MIYEVSSNDVVIHDGSSGGTKLKFYKDGYWYKVNSNGPEGQAEEAVTLFLEHSSLMSDEFVRYESCQIKYRQKIFCGCRSKTFLSDEESFLGYEKAYRQVTGKSLTEQIRIPNSPLERAEFINDFVKRCYSLDVFDNLKKVITLCAVVLNTDCHLNNVGIIIDRNGCGKRVAPIFDNGAAFLSNYSINNPSLVVEEINVSSNVFGKPFASDLDYQAVDLGLAIKFDFKAIKDSIESGVENSRLKKIAIMQTNRCSKVKELCLSSTGVMSVF